MNKPFPRFTKNEARALETEVRDADARIVTFGGTGCPECYFGNLLLQRDGATDHDDDCPRKASKPGLARATAADDARRGAA